MTVDRPSAATFFRLNGPLAEERRRFLCHRAEQGYGRRGLRVLAYYLLACAHSFRLADRPGELISYAEVQEKAALWANRSPMPSVIFQGQLQR